MFSASQMILVCMPVQCDCGKTVWCWFKDNNEHNQYKCSCGLTMGGKIVQAIIPEEESLLQEH